MNFNVFYSTVHKEKLNTSISDDKQDTDYKSLFIDTKFRMAREEAIYNCRNNLSLGDNEISCYYSFIDDFFAKISRRRNTVAMFGGINNLKYGIDYSVLDTCFLHKYPKCDSLFKEIPIKILEKDINKV